MNDVVLDLTAGGAPPAVPVDRMRALTLGHVLRLGSELYAETPLLHRAAPERARRLAMLILTRAPQVNAALFVAPAAGCSPEAVASRLAEVSIDVMAALHSSAREGALTPLVADTQVWRRLAA